MLDKKPALIKGEKEIRDKLQETLDRSKESITKGNSRCREGIRIIFIRSYLLICAAVAQWWSVSLKKRRSVVQFHSAAPTLLGNELFISRLIMRV